MLISINFDIDGTFNIFSSRSKWIINNYKLHDRRYLTYPSSSFLREGAWLRLSISFCSRPTSCLGASPAPSSPRYVRRGGQSSMQLHASAHRGQRRTHTVSPATPPPSARLWRATRHDALGAPGAIGCSPPQPPRTSAARARARPGAPSNNGTASPRQRRHTAGGIRWLGALRRWGTGRTRDGRPELVPRRQQSLAGVYRVPLQGLRRRQGPAVVALCAIRKSCATRVCPRHVMWRSDRNV